MGNKFACGVKSDHQVEKGGGFGDSPYSKTISKSLVRFWAEVFLMSQDGFYGELKWQKVVPKLVPVNLARVQDSPSMVSHVTAYNTKVDKVMDVLIYIPEMQIHRQSDCFLFWEDYQKGLTWGLNFITAEDATHFLNLANGIKRGIISRRANSTASLPLKRAESGKSTTSNPNTPDQRRGPKPTVKFADEPICIPPEEVDSLSQSNPNFSSYPSTPRKPGPSYLTDPSDIAYLSQNSMFSEVETLHLTGQRLSDWDTMMPPADDGRLLTPDGAVCGARSIVAPTSGNYDNLPPLHPHTSEFYSSLNKPDQQVLRNQRENPCEIDVWERQTPVDIESSVAVDSETLRKMLSPIPSESSSARNALAVTPETYHNEPPAPAPDGGAAGPNASRMASQSDDSIWNVSESKFTLPVSQSVISTDTLAHNVLHASFPTNDQIQQEAKFTPYQSSDGSFSNALPKSQSIEIFSTSKQVLQARVKVPPPAMVETGEQLVMISENVASDDRPVSTTSLSSIDNSCRGIAVVRRQNRGGSMPAPTRSARDKARISLYGIRNSFSDAYQSDSSAVGGHTKVLVRPKTTRSNQTTPNVKRSSLHLVTGANGKFRSLGGSGVPSTHSSQNRKSVDSTSLSSAESPVANVNPMESIGNVSQFSNSSHRIHHSASSHKLQARKAGPLLMKAWLCPTESGLVRVLQNELWQQYWAHVKGASLQLQIISEQTGSLSRNGVSFVDLNCCLLQPVPEYPRRQHVFCVSTQTGHAYLLQASSDEEVDSWLQQIHGAAAFSMSRANSREVAIRHLRKEIDKTDQRIETISKMVRLSQLPAVGAVSVNQISDWERELESLNLNQYMHKCYLNALKGSEPPSCKKLLSSTTQSNKSYLSQLGAFTASTVHSLINASKNRFKLSQSASCSAIKRVSTSSASSNTLHHSFESISESNNNTKTDTTIYESTAGLIQVEMPGHQIAVVSVCDSDSVGAVLLRACEQCSVSPERYFLVLRRNSNPSEVLVPDEAHLLEQWSESFRFEVREKLIYHVHLERPSQTNVFGLTIRAHRDVTRNGNVCVTITGVDHDGVAKQKGLAVGDEILVINKQMVRRLTPAVIEEMLHQSKLLCLVLRTKRLSLPLNLHCLNGRFGHSSGSQDSLTLSCSTGSSDDDSRTFFKSDVPFSAGTQIYGSQQGKSQYSHIYSGTAERPPSESSTQSEQMFSAPTTSTGLTGNGPEPPEPPVVPQGVVLRNPQLDLHKRLPAKEARLSLPIINASSLFDKHTSCGSGHSSNSSGNSSSVNQSPHHHSTQAAKGSTHPDCFQRPSYASDPITMNDLAKNAAIKKVALTDEDRLEKAIGELFVSEKTYVSSLDILLRCYLGPLQQKNLVHPDQSQELVKLSKVLTKIYEQQKGFLSDLTDTLGPSFTKCSHFSSPSEMNSAVNGVAGLFRNYTPRFKIYASLCPFKPMCEMMRGTIKEKSALNDFFTAQNPEENTEKCQQTNIDSCLSRPPARVMKYPTILKNICNFTVPDSPTHTNLKDVCQKSDQIAQFLNESDRINETHGPHFKHLSGAHKIEVEELDLSHIVMRGEVSWMSHGDPLKESKRKSQPVMVECVLYVFYKYVVVIPTEKPHQSKARQRKSSVNTEQHLRHSYLIPAHESKIEADVNPKESGGNQMSKSAVLSGSSLESSQHDGWRLIHIGTEGRKDVVFDFVTSNVEIKKRFKQALAYAVGAIQPNSYLKLGDLENGGSQGKPVKTHQSIGVDAQLPCPADSMFPDLQVHASFIDSIDLDHSTLTSYEFMPKPSRMSQSCHQSTNSSGTENSSKRSSKDETMDDVIPAIDVPLSSNDSAMSTRDAATPSTSSASSSSGARSPRDTFDTNSAIANLSTASQQPKACRPGSHYSSQSDAGYGSNGEINTVAQQNGATTQAHPVPAVRPAPPPPPIRSVFSIRAPPVQVGISTDSAKLLTS